MNQLVPIMWKKCWTIIGFSSEFFLLVKCIYVYKNLQFETFCYVIKSMFLKREHKNLEEKDGQRLLLYYVSLIRACNKVL